MAVAAAKAGKDILCEKPIALTVCEGRAIVEAVAKYGRIFQTGSEARLAKPFVRACELARNQRLGKLHTINVEIYEGFGPECKRNNPSRQTVPVPDGFDYDLWLGPSPEAPFQVERCHSSWRFLMDYGRGNMGDWGGHIHDVAQMGNGTETSGPVSVDGRGEFATDGLFDAPVSWEIAYEYSSGVRLVSKSSKVLMVRFEGEKGWAQAGWGAFEASSAEIAKAELGPDDIRLTTYENEHRAFIDCVRERKQTFLPAETGHRSASLAHLGFAAMRTGQKLLWDSQQERFTNNEEANGLLSRPLRAPWTLDL
jgi:predicted dehydrogenase